MKLNVIIEKGKKEFWGRIEGDEDFLPVTVGKSIGEVLSNLKDLVADYIAHEGQVDKKCCNADLNQIDFVLHYDLRAFFDEYNFLNVSSIAKKSKINRSLLAQYVKGIKHPSTAQAKKVETAIHDSANEMQKVLLVGSSV